MQPQIDDLDLPLVSSLGSRDHDLLLAEEAIDQIRSVDTAVIHHHVIHPFHSGRSTTLLVVLLIEAHPNPERVPETIT